MIGHALFTSSYLPGKTITSIGELKGVSLLVLHGGEDISPTIYGEKVGHAHAGQELSRRDYAEVLLANKAKELGIPILGICRGAQLVCSLAGGSLWQHVEGHGGGRHALRYKEQDTWTNTCHHQMMKPTEDMEILATSPCLSPIKWGEDDNGTHATGEEPEILYIPDWKAVAVQGHPEWLSSKDPLVVITKEILEEKGFL